MQDYLRAKANDISACLNRMFKKIWQHVIMLFAIYNYVIYLHTKKMCKNFQKETPTAVQCCFIRPQLTSTVKHLSLKGTLKTQDRKRRDHGCCIF